MPSYDKQKLIRIDEQILNLEYLYERELQREAELNKRTLLLSRGFKYRLDNLYKARTMLVKATGVLNSKEMNYAITLAERKEALETAEHELEILKQRQHDAGVAALVAGQINDLLMAKYNANEIATLSKEIIRQEAFVRNKRRAYDNWINKAGAVQTKERKIPTKKEAEELAQEVLSIEDRKKKFDNYIDSLKENKPENNASIDLLSRPIELSDNNNDSEAAEEVNPFALNEKHNKIII